MTIEGGADGGAQFQARNDAMTRRIYRHGRLIQKPSRIEIYKTLQL